MYNIGDSVVYPTHGAGVIEGIEQKEVLGKMQSYYIMRMPIGDMRVMVPMDNAAQIGVRDVIDEITAEKVLNSFKTAQIDVIQNWSKRFRDNMERIKSGDLYEVCAVIKSLMLRDRQKGLSTGERKMLSNAKQILISEIVVATKTDRDFIEGRLNDMLDEEMENSAG